MVARQILIIKTGALGDVLRTTSILPGLSENYPGCAIAWIVAPGAVDLVRFHSLVHRVIPLDIHSPAQLASVGRTLSDTCWDRVLSFDDEVALCALASRVVKAARGSGVLSGAYLDEEECRVYTEDVRPWFDMSLISRFGKQQADALKATNRRAHAEIFADMLGIRMGRPELPLPERSRQFARDFLSRHGLKKRGPLVGLNTGAGGRWEGKKLPVNRVCELAAYVHERCAGRVEFVVLGGPEEAARNAAVVQGMRPGIHVCDAGVDNQLLDFAAIVDALDLLVSSDSLAMHIGIAREVPMVAFFAPTSADEIHLYGRGESIRSLSPDYCSYRSDASTATLTVERLGEAVLRWLGRH